MKRDNDIQNDPVGILVVLRIIKFLVIICFKIIAFPFRVLIYNNNPLNVKRVKILKNDK